MKISVNYDLIDKAREAKTGFSLHRFGKVVGLSAAILFPVRILGGTIGGESPEKIISSLCLCSTQIVGMTGFNHLGFAPFNKERANEELNKLSTKLGDIFVNTDSDKLKESYQYKVKYELNTDTFPPQLEQKKYIMVPVYNDWDNNERSLVQEHIVGSIHYALSYGEPEKTKVYSLGTKRMIGK